MFKKLWLVFWKVLSAPFDTPRLKTYLYHEVFLQATKNIFSHICTGRPSKMNVRSKQVGLPGGVCSLDFLRVRYKYKDFDIQELFDEQEFRFQSSQRGL